MSHSEMTSKNIRADKSFKDELDNIKRLRLINGFDKELKSDRRLTKAITRTSHWRVLKETLIKSPLDNDKHTPGRKPKFNKRGQSFLDTFVFMAVIFFMLIVFGVVIWFGFNMYSMFGTATRNADNSIINFTEINDNTFGNFYSATKQLRFISYIIIIGMIILIFLSNYLVKENPIYYGFYLIATVIAVIVSVYISNAYEKIIQDATIGSFITTLKEGNFFMLHLPIIIAVVGIFGLIFLLSGTLRDTDLGGGF